MNGKQLNLGRREFLQLGLYTGLVSLAGCTSTEQAPLLRGTPEALSKRSIRSLPSPWKFRPLQRSKSQTPFRDFLEEDCDILVINDGWLLELPNSFLKPINTGRLFERFDKKTRDFLSNLGGDLSLRVLPVAVSPWVMLFRTGEAWIEEAKQSWQVLLDSRLKGLVVLPESPRLVMELADKMQGENRLSRLKNQALVFDDRYGLNWVLEGKARVVVLPLQRCLSALRKDPRLKIALPQSGSPLHWTVLVHSVNSSAPFPSLWVENLFRPPLLGQLLAEGWIPPVTFGEWRSELMKMPERYRESIFPNQETWSQCWSLPPLTPAMEKELSQRWS